MRNAWVRAWLAATALLVAASALAQGRHDTLLEVEEPVMDWLLDGTDTSGWDRASFLSTPWLLVLGTIIVVVGVFFLDRLVSAVIVVSSILATGLTMVVRDIVERPGPVNFTSSAELPPGSFPNLELVQTGVFWGLFVLTIWWIGAPRLVWQIAVELAIVITLLTSIRLMVAGEIWPSDAVGSAIVMAISLILAAIAFEAFAPRMPWLEKSTATKANATA